MGALVLIYPLLFYFANNIERFNIHDITTSILILLGVDVLIITLIRLAFSAINRRHNPLIFNITSGLLFLLLLLMMRHSIFSNPHLYSFMSELMLASIYIKYLIYFIFAILFFSIGFYLTTRNFKAFIIIFIALNLINVIKIIKYNFAKHVSNSSEFVDKKTEKLKIENKKNVFFILVDSMTNINGMKELGIYQNNEPIINELTQRGFTHYPNFYTSLQPTEYALYTYLNMSYLDEDRVAYQADKLFRIENIIGEGKVYKLFKENGYTINLLHEKNLFIGDNCIVDYCFSPENDHKAKILDIFSFLFLPHIAKYVESHSSLFFNPKFRSTNNDLALQFSQQINKLNLQKPNFTYIHAFTYPTHTACEIEIMDRCNEKVEISKYNVRVQETGKFISEMIQSILIKDKNALIIFAGDHGPYISQKCTRDGVRSRDQILERQGAFLSIYWGSTYHGKYDEQIKSSHNLFRYIFSFLAQNESILINNEKDDAYTLYNNFQFAKTIEDGKFKKMIKLA
jgi:hypothetical protein